MAIEYIVYAKIIEKFNVSFILVKFRIKTRHDIVKKFIEICQNFHRIGRISEDARRRHFQVTHKACTFLWLVLFWSVCCPYLCGGLHNKKSGKWRENHWLWCMKHCFIWIKWSSVVGRNFNTGKTVFFVQVPPAIVGRQHHKMY